MATDPFAEALRAAYQATPGAALQRFPVENHWEPQVEKLGTAKADADQSVNPTVPRVPRVPSENGTMPHRMAAEAASEALATWDERAAIREYEGGMSRREAELTTAMELGPRPEAPAET